GTGCAAGATSLLKAGTIVDRVAPGVAGDQLQPMGHPLGHVELQSIVIGVSIGNLLEHAVVNTPIHDGMVGEILVLEDPPSTFARGISETSRLTREGDGIGFVLAEEMASQCPYVAD